MEDMPVLNDVHEMSKIAEELFSIIPGMQHASQVPVLESEKLTEREFKNEWVARNQPCLIKGAVKNWPAVKKWKDKNYWIATCRNDKREIITHMNYYSWKRKGEGSESMPFHDAIERLFAGGDHIFSIPSQVVTENNLFAGIIKDIPGFTFLLNKQKPIWDNARGLFIYRRASTAWHVHYCDETLMCQVKGAKQVAMLPPYMPEAKHVTDFLESEAYLDGKALDQSLDLKMQRVTVEEGDSLYIPPHWFHCVVPTNGELGFTSLTVFRSPWHKYGRFSNYFVPRLYQRTFKGASAGMKVVIPFLAGFAVLSYFWRRITGGSYAK